MSLFKKEKTEAVVAPVPSTKQENGMQLFKDKQDFIDQYRAIFESELGKTFEECDDLDRYSMLAKLIAVKSRSIESATTRRAVKSDQKKVYYFCLEFLIGKLLDNYLMDYGARELVAEGLDELGSDLATLCDQEADAGLGNGGLGRLAACFLDSMATLGIAGYGNGMRYRYGLFRQEIKDGCQVEETDNWLAHGYPFEARKPESAVVVRFNGDEVRHEENGKFWFTWDNADEVLAVPYDVPVVGYDGKTVNKLRLWSAEPAREDFDLDAFNSGDYAKAMKFRSDVEAISTILYPNDAGEHGRLLRLKQEYLFVSAGLQTIIRTYHKEHGNDWAHFADHVAIHTNDTHPALCGPELMRILIDDEGLDWDAAWAVVKGSVSFTNHTIMPEALEKWPINTFRTLLPRVYTFVEEIDRRYRESFPRDRYDNWQDMLRNTAILWDGQVRMANLSIICSHSVNGVSDLHTNILEHEVFKDYYEIDPGKFNNKTNGISHRRFLGEANPSYSKLITSAIGDRWMTDSNEFEKLVPFEKDASFLEDMEASRLENKKRLAAYVEKASGVVLDPNTIYDAQIKRFHSYKRQLLNVFKVLDLYNRLCDDPSLDIEPTSFIFAGKAAQSYFFAKEVIRLINSTADVINNDKRVNDKIRVAFVPNFAVSNAQYIYSAADISEQISTAGKEASGTSNMKLMLNGAITLGTYDGANVEIAKLVGEENIKIFGMRVEDVEALRASGQYWAWNEYNSDRDRTGRIVDELTDGTLARLSGNFENIHDELMTNNDQEFILRDFKPYVEAFEELNHDYRKRQEWFSKALHNTAKSGFFSSDRTIEEYAREIWHAE
jgi:starch phosphorylase